MSRAEANKARARPLAERFAAKYVVLDSGCWKWTGSIGTDGYGKIRADDRTAGAHRISYELHVGPIASGTEVHHLCGHRDCVNPEHLILVTRQQHCVIGNRAFVCGHGHPRRPSPRGVWVCPTCQAAASRRYKARKQVQQ